MNRRLLLAALGSLLLCNSPVWAVNSYPMVMGIKPVACRPVRRPNSPCRRGIR